ncbi:hypothetical protein QYF61_001075 [Mycteria americana]|uniref:Uncharacterized protein n=1 Tax=Mycteria americana TaxID=33587 RepID=A0AAN7MY12_MYCAM|nr:hypothetical protein QYF61_001075 [Mycteria americana]
MREKKRGFSLCSAPRGRGWTRAPQGLAGSSCRQRRRRCWAERVLGTASVSCRCQAVEEEGTVSSPAAAVAGEGEPGRGGGRRREGELPAQEQPQRERGLGACPSCAKPCNFLYVGLMTAQKYLGRQAVATQRTWAPSVPGRVEFFSSQGSAPLLRLPPLPVITLPGVDGSYPQQQKSFMMIKYMHDHYLDKYQWVDPHPLSSVGKGQLRIFVTVWQPRWDTADLPNPTSHYHPDPDDLHCQLVGEFTSRYLGTGPVPMLDNPFGEEIFSNIQSKPPLAQLEAISSRPITCYLGEETDPHLSTTSFQVVVESNKVSPQPPFLQAKQPQFPQPLLIRLVLQTLHQLHCPSLDMLQHLNVSLVVRGPKLNTVFEVRPHQCRVQGHDHFPSPAGHTISDTSQDGIGFLGHLGTLLAHIQVAVNQHPQVLLCWPAFQPLFPKPVELHGIAVAQVQDLALGFVKPHTIGLGPLIQPVQIPL